MNDDHTQHQLVLQPAPFVPLNIAGTEYPIQAHVNTSEAFDIIHIVSNKDRSYRECVASFLFDRISSLPFCTLSDEDVAELPDEILLSFLNIITLHNPELQDIYASLHDYEDEYHHHLLSYYTYINNSIVKATKELIANPIAKTISHSVAEMATSIGKKLVDFYKDHLVDLISRLTEYISSIELPHISDEEKGLILRVAESWGTQGWTTPFRCPIYHEYQIPESQASADDYMQQFCIEDDMESLFFETRQSPFIVVDDFDEAVFSYQQHKFKSCALVLFALIDGLLIERQRDEDRNYRNRRLTGKGASIKLFGHIHSEDYGLRSSLALYFFITNNVLACLKTVFEDGNDFMDNPAVINRNYIGHGMSKRKVTQKDCHQLFLLYYNLMQILVDFSN